MGLRRHQPGLENKGSQRRSSFTSFIFFKIFVVRAICTIFVSWLIPGYIAKFEQMYIETEGFFSNNGALIAAIFFSTTCLTLAFFKIYSNCKMRSVTNHHHSRGFPERFLTVSTSFCKKCVLYCVYSTVEFGE